MATRLMDERELTEALRWLDRWLIGERARRGGWMPEGFSYGDEAEFAQLERCSDNELWDVFRTMVNTREPWPIDEAFAERQDAVLQTLIARAGVTDAAALAPAALDERLSLWRGDITTLAADAIVNAANSELLGCWAPGHFCIDNAIHTYAGVQLRLACYELMCAQGHLEPTGRAQVTPAFNLPSRFVIHTVGPIANGAPTERDAEELASCYRSCLDAAADAGCASIAFCSISTGVFGYPIEQAAPIAIDTVRVWLDAHRATPLHVTFNVFSPTDESLYRSLLVQSTGGRSHQLRPDDPRSTVL